MKWSLCGHASRTGNTLMDDDHDVDQRLAADDDEALIALEHAHTMRPHRKAWRIELEDAPVSRPVFARRRDSVRVLIAMREPEEWLLITRDGECQTIEDIVEWAPLTAAFN